MSQNYPVVLSFSGHDPSGGAGIQADIETLVSHRCHSVSVITALTEQDSSNVKKLIPQHPQDIINQAQTLLDDMTISVIKIGLIGHAETALAIHTVLQKYPDIPVILDPVLAAGGGKALSNEALIKAINEYLLPCTTVLTPNRKEARLLSGLENVNDCAMSLLEKGSDYVLITGADENTEKNTVENQLFHQQKCMETFTWDRLPDSYHGSGCTLASSIAGLMAQGLEPFSAISEAQDYTWNSLDEAYKIGRGQYNPQRLFWMEAG
ncbi:MAG: hydroxymethylpyrimidine/phosphomethylpyrimidine kinase [Methylococcaceae bacterium]|nr:hydroxymethylpyrimidine/phosphomethylpyrimidine kinase [Methylococcaceae bacterium]